MPEKQSSFLNLFRLGSKKSNSSTSITDDMYKEAISLFKNKEIDKAQDQLENILKTNPEHQGSLFNLGKIYLYKNKGNEATDLFKKYLDNNPNSFDGKIRLSESYIKINEFESAIGILNQLKNIDLTDLEKVQVNNSLIYAYDSQAKYFKAQKKFKECISCFDQVYRFDKDKEKYLYNQALCFKEWKKYDKAKELFNEIIKNSKSKYLIDSYYHLGQIEESRNIKRAILTYREFINNNPQSDFICFFMAKIDFLQENYESAVENYLKSLLLPKFINEIYLGTALSYMFQKNFNQAIEFFEKTLNKDINTKINLVICKIQTGDVVKAFGILNKIGKKDFYNNPNSTKEIGIALLESGILEKAFETLLIAKKILPNDPEVWVNIAKYYKKIGDIQKYNEEIEKVLKDYPNDISVLKELSTIYKENNQDEKVIETYNIMLDADPRNKEPLRLMAEFYQSRKNMKQAIIKYNEYHSFIKSDIESTYNLAICYFENIQINQAIKELEKIENHIFHGLTACSLLTDIYISKGETDIALKYIQKCFEFSPSYIDGYIKYGKIFAHSGQINKALEYIKYAEKIDPNNKDVQHLKNYYSSMKKS